MGGSGEFGWHMEAGHWRDVWVQRMEASAWGMANGSGTQEWYVRDSAWRYRMERAHGHDDRRAPYMGHAAPKP
eukprot:278984-Chlamydomonas_euryale.AAC.6